MAPSAALLFASAACLLLLNALCVLTVAAAPVPAAAYACDGAQHSGPIAVTIDSADPPAGPVAHDGCEYAQSLTFVSPTNSVGALEGVTFRIMRTSVGGDLTFAASLRLGAGCSIVINGSFLGGLAIDSPFVAAVPISLADTALDGLFGIAPDAALPCGTNVTVRRSVLMGLDLEMHHGGLDIDSSNTFDAGYGGLARDSVRVMFATAEGLDACVTPPWHTLVLRGGPAAASLSNPRVVACVASDKPCIPTDVLVAALQPLNADGRSVLRRARIVIDGIGVVGHVDVEADEMENISVAVRNVVTVPRTQIEAASDNIIGSDFAVERAMGATDPAVLGAFGEGPYGGGAMVFFSFRDTFVCSSLFVANVTMADPTAHVASCDNCAVAFDGIEDFSSLQLQLHRLVSNASIAIRRVNSTAGAFYLMISAAFVGSSVCIEGVVVSYFVAFVHRGYDHEKLSNDEGDSSIALANFSGGHVNINLDNPQDFGAAAIIGADLLALTVRLSAAARVSLHVRDAVVESRTDLVQSRSAVEAGLGVHVIVADSVFSDFHFIFEDWDGPNAGCSYVFSNLTLSSFFSFGMGGYSDTWVGEKPYFCLVNSTVRLDAVSMAPLIDDEYSPGISFAPFWLVNTSVAIVGVSVVAPAAPTALEFASLRLLEGSALLVADCIFEALERSLRIALPMPPNGEALSPDGVTYDHGHSDEDILGPDLAPRGIDRSVPSSVTIRRTVFGAPSLFVALTNASLDMDASNSYEAQNAAHSISLYSRNASQGLNWALVAPPPPLSVDLPTMPRRVGYCPFFTFMAGDTAADDEEEDVLPHSITQTLIQASDSLLVESKSATVMSSPSRPPTAKTPSVSALWSASYKFNASQTRTRVATRSATATDLVLVTASPPARTLTLSTTAEANAMLATFTQQISLSESPSAPALSSSSVDPSTTIASHPLSSTPQMTYECPPAGSLAEAAPFFADVTVSAAAIALGTPHNLSLRHADSQHAAHLSLPFSITVMRHRSLRSVGGNQRGFAAALPTNMHATMHHDGSAEGNSTHQRWALHVAPMPDYVIEEDEALDLFARESALVGELCGGPALVHIGTLRVVPSDSRSLAETKDATVGVSIIGTTTTIILGSGGIASEQQGLSAMAMMTCADPHTQKAFGSYRALSPFALWDSYIGVIAGNFAFLAAVFLIQVTVLLCLRLAKRTRRWEELSAVARFPAVLLNCSFAVHTGTAYAASQLITSDDRPLEDRIVGGLAFAFVVVYPFGLVGVAYKFVGRAYQRYAMADFLEERQWPAWTARLLPRGAIYSSETRKTFGALVSAYRLSGPHWPSYPTWTPMVFAIGGLFHPDTIPKCQALFVCMGLAFIALCVLVLAQMPRRSDALNYVDCAARVLSASVLFCMAIAIVPGDDGRNAALAAMAFGFIQTGVTVIRSLYALAVTVLDRRLQQLPLAQEWVHYTSEGAKTAKQFGASEELFDDLRTEVERRDEGGDDEVALTDFGVSSVELVSRPPALPAASNSKGASDDSLPSFASSDSGAAAGAGSREASSSASSLSFSSSSESSDSKSHSSSNSDDDDVL